MTTPKRFFLSPDLKASACLLCGDGFTLPVRWHNIQHGGVMVMTHCGQCDEWYTLIMSLAQAAEWDRDLLRQMVDMRREADILESLSEDG